MDNKKDKTYLLPGLEWIAPRVTSWEVANPATMPAVKVEVVGRSLHDLEALLDNGGSILRGNPDPRIIQLKSAWRMMRERDQEERKQGQKRVRTK